MAAESERCPNIAVILSGYLQSVSVISFFAEKPGNIMKQMNRQSDGENRYRGKKMKTEIGKITWKTRIAYGGGDASCNIVMGMISTILTMFYTDYIGLSAATAGAIMLVSKFLDGAATLAMGFIAERTKSKYGKYRPWLLWTCVPYAVSIVLLFTVPKSTVFAKTVYVFVTYNLCTTVMYNAMNVPYGSLAYVLTRAAEERDLLSIVRMIMASAARLVTVCGTLPLVKVWGDGQDAWVKAAAIWAGAAALLQLFCFRECEEQTERQNGSDQGRTGLLSSIRNVLGNKYFWAGACFQSMQTVLFAVTGTSLTYYCKYVFGNDSWMYSVLYFIEMGSLIIAMMFCPLLVKRFGKRNTCLAGCAVAIAGHSLLMLFPGNLFCVAGSCLIRSVGFAPLNSVCFAFLGEAVEYGQWKTGQRQESLIYAASTVTLKISSGIAAWLMTVLLGTAGYVSAGAETILDVQPQSAVDMIIGIYKYGPVIVLVICFVTLLAHRLEKQMPRIMKEL